MKFSARICLLLALTASAASAGPLTPAGDVVLRMDIQRLADAGVIKGTTSTWPMAWGPILEDLRSTNAATLSPGVADAFARVRDRAKWETRSGELTFNAELGLADNLTRMRSFQNTPRGRVEAGVGVGWTDDWLSVDLNGQYVDSGQDDNEFRADNSMIGVVVGNWSLAVSTLERWWGPGWDGSVILSNNARPFPSVTFDRIFTDAFRTRWLSWLGPWDLSVMFGQLEKEREIPNARFFGMRFNFRPIDSLEIGLSRTAQWCGDGRPCNFSTFVDLFLGRDNRGADGVNLDNEPGNQLAAIDFRWSPGLLEHSVALYGQFVGEDEAGGFPSRYLGQLGGEWSGLVASRWSTKVFAEFAGTSCQFYESSELFNCAYNHGIYQTGYRFRGRTIGHGADNDARIISAGVFMADADDTQWRGHVRFGALNRGGPPDPRNSLTPTRQDIVSVDVSHSRVFSFGVIDVGVGYESVDDDVSGTSTSDARFYVQWRSAY
ncbi:MAG: capsule assembly Wzi family protein [Woeseiaceae bacterium]|nr:capsule assembly Wzi family protein [Woeseiaceae bacterium]